MIKNTKIIHSLLCVLLLCVTQNLNAQVFEVKEGSKIYDARINVKCDKDQCDGKAEVTLIKKASRQIFQRFTSKELTMYLDEKFQPSVNVVQLYDEQSPLIFQDFNFNGTEDLAIRNGNYGAYGGPVYDVYVFNKTRQKFVLSKALSALTQKSLGMFSVDEDTKRLITFNKSGCCYHVRSEYQVIPKKGLLLVKEFIEDAQSGEWVRVIERNLIKGKWIEKVKKYPVEEYYKE